MAVCCVVLLISFRVLPYFSQIGGCVEFSLHSVLLSFLLSSVFLDVPLLIIFDTTHFAQSQRKTFVHR